MRLSLNGTSLMRYSESSLQVIVASARGRGLLTVGVDLVFDEPVYVRAGERDIVDV